ncbi:MAG: hypothetical protein FJ044_03730, partial [Candidatus Cloacimonetes bacterium]|nr:hypothetical protein [Candidatus Cloacimonadota bacterium]
NNRKTKQPVTLTPAPTGFVAFTTPTVAEINVNIPKETFPKEVSTYQILPAPYELFSPEAAQVIAQTLGFTQAASAKTTGNLYIYTESAKTLTINKVSGFINYSIPLRVEELGKGAISENTARTKVKQFFKTLGLDQPFFNWESAEVKAYALKNGGPKETALSTETCFLEFTPILKIHDFAIEATQTIFVRVSREGEIIGLSFWYPNFDWDNPRKVSILSVSEARKKVETGEGNLISQTNESLAEVDLTTIKLVHFVPAEYLVDFATPRYTRPMFVFGGDAAKVYLEAEK